MKNESTLNLNDIHNKNINFLIGSGASFGLFPTLELKIKNKAGLNQTIESLATHFDEIGSKELLTALFMHYYKTCIKPVMETDYEEIHLLGKEHEIRVLDNYIQFINTIVEVLKRRKKFNKRCNLFTTNYDGCISYAADQLISTGNIDFILNDGASGFSKRYLHAKNYNRYTCETGVFERHQTDIPQINLIHLHGSTYWQSDQESIIVNYSKMQNEETIIETDILSDLSSFSETILSSDMKIEDITKISLTKKQNSDFWDAYKKIPIVNPTKWKFHETLFEEHYYQMLRLLSYELEKPNSIFITFGFSFADEHILNLVKRSLSNPRLQVFICCFNHAEKKSLSIIFRQFHNIVLLTVDEYLDFNAFNDSIFTLNPNRNEGGDASNEL